MITFTEVIIMSTIWVSGYFFAKSSSNTQTPTYDCEEYREKALQDFHSRLRNNDLSDHIIKHIHERILDCDGCRSCEGCTCEEICERNYVGCIMTNLKSINVDESSWYQILAEIHSTIW
jgi:hypothetical protein